MLIAFGCRVNYNPGWIPASISFRGFIRSLALLQFTVVVLSQIAQVCYYTFAPNDSFHEEAANKKKSEQEEEEKSEHGQTTDGAAAATVKKKWKSVKRLAG
jgi:Na+-transporting methylmalonyl-CoA/oxaloacetate decarboxylase gamma subunit